MNIIKKYILNDFKLKALAVLLAVMLWSAVSYLGEFRMSFSVKVGFEGLGRDFMITDVTGDEVLVNVSGPVSILKNIHGGDIRLAVNLADEKEGNHTISLLKTNAQVPTGVKVDALKPDFVTVQLDRVMEKRLKTVVRLGTRWETLYEVKSWSPQYIIAEGPKGALISVNGAETIPIDGDFTGEEETIEVPVDTRGMMTRKIRPEIVTVVLRRR